MCVGGTSATQVAIIVKQTHHCIRKHPTIYLFTHRRLQAWAQIMRTHITRTRCEDTWSPAYRIYVHRCTHGVQCSDKIRFPQLRIKCGVANSSLGAHAHSSLGTYDITFALYKCISVHRYTQGWKYKL